MNTPPTLVDLINQNVTRAKDLGIAHQIVEEVNHHGRTINLEGREFINFGSCSYLGLETDTRLKEAAIETVLKYGVHFSSSRSYLSLQPYQEIEDLLEKVFGHPVIVTSSTTLGHMAIMPLLIAKDDAIIMDHQVHSSVQFTVKLTGLKEENIEKIRHNKLDYLENRIKKLSLTHKRIFYMADSVYSMYGDTAPLDELYDLLERYEQFHLYIDDAHGTSWSGENGCGYVLGKIPYHPRMTMVTSLGKGFGTSGGAIVCYDNNLKELVKNCGGTLMFSGPLQPATLGAAIASAKIHLSEEIDILQEELQNRISYFHRRATQLELPVVGQGETPIFFIGMGKTSVGYALCNMLKEAGFFTCIAAYPSVPLVNTGLRMMVNLHHSYSDIDALLDTIADYFPKVLKEENFQVQDIYKAFRMNSERAMANSDF